MHFNRVKRTIDSTLRNGTGAALPDAGTILKIQSSEDTTFVVSDTHACKQVLLSPAFGEYRYSEVLGRIFDLCGTASRGLIEFFRKSPLEWPGAGEGHKVLRAGFKAVYGEILKTELTHPDSVQAGTSARDYANACIGDFYRRAFTNLLGTGDCYRAVSGINGFEIFDILVNPARLASISRRLDVFYESFPRSDPLIAQSVREVPEAFLTLIMMGRDPLMATIVSWLNDIIRGGDGSSVGYGSVAPVNFIPRICIERVRLGEFDVEPGQAVYVLLSIANRSENLGGANGLAFGYGPHFCLGYQFASTMFDRFKSTFDRNLAAGMSPSPPVIKNAFTVAL